MIDLRKILENVPEKPGVYLFKKNEKVLYVGKAINLKNRLSSYLSDKSQKVIELIEKSNSIDYIITDDEKSALLLELSLIRKYDPPYNIKLKGEPYPYIAITKEEFPRIEITRNTKEQNKIYFGPYVNPSFPRKLISITREIFKIRNCNLRLPSEKKHKLCIEYHIGRCSGPCAKIISKEEYNKSVSLAIELLKGNTESIEKYLREEIESSVKELKFEKAIKLRDGLRAILEISNTNGIWTDGSEDRDFIGYAISNKYTSISKIIWRNGRVIGKEEYIITSSLDNHIEKFILTHYENALLNFRSLVIDYEFSEEFLNDFKNLISSRINRDIIIRKPNSEEMKTYRIAMENAEENLKRYVNSLSKKQEHPSIEELKKLLKLEKVERIEAIDISHYYGEGKVGSVVVFINGRPQKREYRRYKIKNLKDRKIDDYKSIEEVVRRRIRRLLEENKDLPDLILIDGGIGQLNSALKVIREFNLSIRAIALAKRYEEIVLENGKVISLPVHSLALRLIQHIRNEAHRFALQYQRKLREKLPKTSILDTIPGISERKKLELIRYFGSIEKIRKASIEELKKVPGIGEKLARKIHLYLKV
ncbi:MAG: excinuclease ABC subunit UvrC [candidate division WOR-3 bacterium]|nr:excinuclease ABC subunit UvrC [candidate division WOR-3 bacterium]MDW8149996.1 excinuclease ABC subunit UvrC [candidate division WOR-3 bacterium]